MRQRNDPSSLRSFAVIALALAVSGQSAIEAYWLVHERERLEAVRASQEDGVNDANYQASDFDKLVTATVTLANSGDANVLPVMEELKQLGAVSLSP